MQMYIDDADDFYIKYEFFFFWKMYLITWVAFLNYELISGSQDGKSSDLIYTAIM